MQPIQTPKKIKPLGNSTPWVWVIEPSHGCNLACGHCCAELIHKKDEKLMSLETWYQTFAIIRHVSPTVRIDISGIVGEPTLNPDLVAMMKIARNIAPLVQIQITTNGIYLLNGKVKYKDLLDAGANIIYTDQYGSHEDFETLAKQSGYPFYQYYNHDGKVLSPWLYHGPDLKMIVLQDQPLHWPESRYKAGLLGNWYGNLNWDKGKRFHMKPLEKPLTRRCNQPFYFVNVAANGNYLLCCQDGMQITGGKFGNVAEGKKGFYDFWFGEKMQLIRKALREKNRAGITFACAKCNVTFSRCDLISWKNDPLTKYSKNNRWYPIIPKEITLDD